LRKKTLIFSGEREREREREVLTKIPPFQAWIDFFSTAERFHQVELKKYLL
jgi:hypothetical protein